MENYLILGVPVFKHIRETLADCKQRTVQALMSPQCARYGLYNQRYLLEGKVRTDFGDGYVHIGICFAKSHGEYCYVNQNNKM